MGVIPTSVQDGGEGLDASKRSESIDGWNMKATVGVGVCMAIGGGK